MFFSERIQLKMLPMENILWDGDKSSRCRFFGQLLAALSGRHKSAQVSGGRGWLVRGQVTMPGQQRVINKFLQLILSAPGALPIATLRYY